MTYQLLKEAFEKAGKETGKVSANGRAEFISETILSEYKYSISAKSLIRYFKGVSAPNRETEDYLGRFIGYENYESYVVKNSTGTEATKNLKLKSKFSVPKQSLFVGLLLIPIIGISAFLGYTRGEKKCMLWQEVRYIETPCTGTEQEREFIPYLFENFKKIEVTDTTSFFKNGKPRIWYNKRNNELEFFTAPGIHPENGKTLKPITEYMINKYIRR